MVVCVCFPKGVRNFWSWQLESYISALFCAKWACRVWILTTHHSTGWITVRLTWQAASVWAANWRGKTTDCNLIVCEELHVVLKHFSSSMCELSPLVSTVPMQPPPPPLCNLQKALGDKIKKTNLLHSYLQKNNKTQRIKTGSVTCIYSQVHCYGT